MEGGEKVRRALVFAVALIMVVGAVSFAWAGDASTKNANQANVPQLQISDAQKAKLTSLWTQILEVKKEILKDNLKKGVITQDQYNAMEKRLDARLEAIKSGKFTPGMRHKMHKGMSPDKDRCPQGCARWQQPQTQS